jgi:hypothetical protein
MVRRRSHGNVPEVIHGFPEQPSVGPGERLVLRVSTDAPAFRVVVRRYGAHRRPVWRSGWWEGRHAPPHLPHQDWGRDDAGLRGEPLSGWTGYPSRTPGRPGSTSPP